MIENMVTPTPLDHDQLQTAASGSVALKVPGLTIKQNQALATEFAIEAAVRCRSSNGMIGSPRWASAGQIAFDPGASTRVRSWRSPSS